MSPGEPSPLKEWQKLPQFDLNPITVASQFWHRADSQFYRKTLEEMHDAFPQLEASEKYGRVFFRGPFFLTYEEREVARFEIEVELPQNYPVEIPVVRDLKGEVPRNANYHTDKDGKHCLFVPGERWKYWPMGSTLVDFMEGAVRSFFIGVVHKNLTGIWPFDQRGHSEKGVFEAYSEMLGFENREITAAFIRILAHDNPKGHTLCPCGSGKKLRDCHRQFIEEWRGKISVSEAKEAAKTLENYTLSNNQGLQRALRTF